MTSNWYISKELRGKSGIAQSKITEQEWKAIVNADNELFWREGQEHGSIELDSRRDFSVVFDYIEKRKTHAIHLNFHPKVGYAIVDLWAPLNYTRISKLLHIASKLNAYLLKGPRTIITQEYIDENFKGHSDELDENLGIIKLFELALRWMVVGSQDVSFVLKQLGITNFRRLPGVSENLEVLYDKGMIILPPVDEWIILSGNNLPELLVGELSINSHYANLDALSRRLEELSVIFHEVQYYEYYHRSTNIVGFFKAENGKLLYGSFKNEDRIYERGKLPDELRNVDLNDVFEVADKWSINPKRISKSNLKPTQKATEILYVENSSFK